MEALSGSQEQEHSLQNLKFSPVKITDFSEAQPYRLTTGTFSHVVCAF